ncbi:flagellar basal-body MS-ring/collar protein FliF [Priestia aryabhattai]
MNQRVQMLKQKWNNIGFPIKLAIGTVGLALIIFILFSFFMPDKYQVLYSGLQEKDQTEIEKYLSNKGIDYTVDSETQALMVNGDVVQLKKELALEGLPEGGSTGGLDIFNNMSLGATKYDKDVQYQNALQKELNSSLEGMFDGIANADVKLPKPEEQSIFSDNKKTTQVSVALKLRSGYDLTPEQVKAVQVYVAGAINNVKAADVQVVDQNFNLLSSSDTKDTSVNKQRQIVEETKKKMESELESALSEVYGRVKVIVNVDINFDEIARNIKKYDPEGTLVSKEQNPSKIRKITGDDVTVPGTDENGEVPNYEMDNADSSKILDVEDKDSIIENFAVGETVEKIIKQPELRNTNISVWFNDTRLTQPDLYDAEEMVAVASGLTGTVQRVANDKAVYNNGSVKVTKKKFAEDLPETTTEKVVEKGFFESLPWYAYAAAGLVLLVIIIAIIFFIRRSKKNRTVNVERELIREQGNVSSPISNNGNDSVRGMDRSVDTDEEVRFNVPDELEDEMVESLSGKLDIEWTQEQKDLRDLTNNVAKRYPKETAEVISKIMKK